MPAERSDPSSEPSIPTKEHEYPPVACRRLDKTGINVLSTRAAGDESRRGDE
jgi:hypothetical protein